MILGEDGVLTEEVVQQSVPQKKRRFR